LESLSPQTVIVTLAVLSIVDHLTFYLSGRFSPVSLLGLNEIVPLLSNLAIDAAFLAFIARGYYWVTLFVVFSSFLGVIVTFAEMFSASSLAVSLLLMLEMTLSLAKALVARVALMRISRERLAA